MSSNHRVTRKTINTHRNRATVAKTYPAKPMVRPSTKTGTVTPKDELATGPGLWVQVAQGLGDIFWVYQKLAPHFDLINFQISVCDKSNVSTRSNDWLKILPKVGKVRLKTVGGSEYEKLISGKFYVKDVLKQWAANNRYVKYCCNKFLEEGTRLDEIDEYPVEWNVPLQTQEVKIPFDEYVTLYVSGSTKSEMTQKQHHVWSVQQWVDFHFMINDRCKINYPVVLIGADFDRDTILEVEQKLKERNVPVASYIQHSPSRVCHILKNSKLFVGYQSGLNIVADNLNVPQVMVYFQYLEPMQYTWCKRENIKTLFHSGLFTEGPEAIAERLDGLGETLAKLKG